MGRCVHVLSELPAPRASFVMLAIVAAFWDAAVPHCSCALSMFKAWKVTLRVLSKFQSGEL